MKKKLIITNLVALLISLLSVLLLSSFFIYNKDYESTAKEAKNYLSLTTSFFNGANNEETKNAVQELGADVELIVVNENGDIIINSKDNNALNDVLTWPCLRSDNLGQVFVQKDTISHKSRMYVAGLDNNNYIIITVPFHYVTQKINKLIIFGVLAFVVFGVASSFYLNYAHNKLLQEVNASTNKTKELIISESKKLRDLEEVPIIINDFNLKIERKISEFNVRNEEINVVLDTLKQGVALINKYGRLILVNEQLKTIFDIESSVINRNYVNIIRSVELQNLIERGLKEREHSNYIHHEDGRTIRSIVTPLELTWLDGGLIVTFEDITAEYNIDKTKKDFFHNASHELKSPLTSIIGYQQMITEGIVTDEESMKEYSFKTLSEATRMKSILLDMLDLAVLEQEYVLVNENVKLDELIRDIVRSMEDRMKEKDIGIRLSLEETEIDGEQKLLDELIRNLIDNAIKYNKEKGSIEVVLKNKKLTISDTGIGIAERDKHRIFERFYRVDKGRSKARGGTGLGLAIVKHICELYGYDIYLDSHIGKGTEITIDFSPRKKQ